MKELPLESILGLILVTVLIVTLKNCEGGNEQTNEKLSRAQAEICEEMRGAKLLRCIEQITNWEEN